MKKLMLIALSAFVMVSCKKNSDDNNTSTASVSAKVDGAVSKFSTVQSMRQTSSGTESVMVSGTTSTGESMSVSVSKSGGVTTGTYNGFNGVIMYTTSTTGYYCTNGTITITAIDAKHVEGTFSGTATSTGGSSKVITEGSFYGKF